MTKTSAEGMTEVIICNCVSQCGILVVEDYGDPDCHDVYVTYYANGAYPNVASRLKLLWALITGKRHLVYSVAVESGQWKRFIESEQERLGLVTLLETNSCENCKYEGVLDKLNGFPCCDCGLSLYSCWEPKQT